MANASILETMVACKDARTGDSAMDELNMFGEHRPNVVGGARCGESWPEPTVDGVGDQVISYIHISRSGVLELYLWDSGSSRWTHRVSTTKEKLIEEYNRRNR